MALHPLIVEIEVVNTQGHKGWWIDHKNHIKTYHKEPDSRDANEYIIKTIAKALHMSNSQVCILQGHETPFKEVRIGADVTREQFLEKLGVQGVRE